MGRCVKRNSPESAAFFMLCRLLFGLYCEVLPDSLGEVILEEAAVLLRKGFDRLVFWKADLDRFQHGGILHESGK